MINEIESKSEFRANKHRDRFMAGADPWVIALARSIQDCTVVTAEKKSLTDYGMGAVCDAIGVKCTNLVDLFEVNKIGF